ncbi:MAG TPA: alpha/beta fold hydrolase [Ilumatobacter sp.]|nr:alpha/beta fold hydrolase [Ilumatobacter sp.]
MVDSNAPVMLVHGWGGSFAATWQRSGFTELLADAGREVIGVDLLGHGDAPKPHDPHAYADLTTRLLDALPERPVDAIGFSMGAVTLLRAAAAHPHRFQRLVVAGIGRNVFERDDAARDRIIAAIEGDGASQHNEEDDNQARLFAQYAAQPGNDAKALTAAMRAPSGVAITPELLASITCPVLVAVGDRDFVLPADQLVDSLPDARYVELRRTDHFATPESFEFIDAALQFLDAVPA